MLYMEKKHVTAKSQAFADAFSDFDWTEICQEIDMPQAYSLFHSKILGLYNTKFPKQKLKLKDNTRKLWFTAGLKDAIEKISFIRNI